MSHPIDALFELQELELALEESKTTSSSGRKAEADLSGRISERRRQIDPAHLSVYDRIRQRYTIAIVAVHEGKCSGCFLAVPRGSILESQRTGSLLACPHCGRLLKPQ